MATDPPEEQRRRNWMYRRSALSFERVAFFTDAVFAIAMTLLIVSVEAPELTDPSSPGSLLESIKIDLGAQIFSFFLAFVLLARYWMAHHAFFSILGRIDRTFITLNLTYLAFVAFLPFPTELVGKYNDNPMSVVLFGITLGVISTLEAITFRHAHRAGLFTQALTEPVYRYGMIQSLTPVALFLLSIPLAFVSTSLALLSWLLTIPIGIVLERRHADEARGYEASAAPSDDEPD